MAIEANEARLTALMMDAAIETYLVCCERDGACNLGDEHDGIICGGRCPCAQKSLEIFRILRKPRIGTGRQGRAVKVAVGKDNLSMHEEIKQNHEQTFLAFDKRVLALEACIIRIHRRRPRGVAILEGGRCPVWSKPSNRFTRGGMH